MGTTDDGGSNPVGGVLIIDAKDTADACKLAQTCPVRESGGSVVVAEIMPI